MQLANTSMKKLHFISCLIIVAITAMSSIAAPPPYERPDVYRINKVNPHSANCPSDNSSYHILLNRGWRVCRYATPKQAIAFAESRSSMTRLRTVTLPATWPNDDSITVVSTEITLPTEWRGRNTRIKFGAAGPAMHLYVNGRMAGYSEDSYTPAEWDITKLLNEGRNRLTLCIYSKSDATDIEPQETPRGITRDVELISLPPLHIMDYNLHTSIDDNGNGLMDLTVDLSDEVRGGQRIEIVVTDTSLHTSHILLKRSLPLAQKDWFASFSEKDNTIGPVVAWSAAHPHLYQLDIRFYNASDNIIHSVSTPIGFCRLREENQLWCINGCPLQIRGIAWDEPLPRPTPEVLRETLDSIKQCGYNLIRLQRPASELFYTLCDQIGLMVWNCCAIATRQHAVIDNDEYEEAIIYRAFNLMRRDRSHPCIIAWGVNDGMPTGYCTKQIERFFSGRDAMRPFICRPMGASNNLCLKEKQSMDYLDIIGRNPNGRSYLLIVDDTIEATRYAALWDTIARYPALQGMVCGHWNSLTEAQRAAHLRIAHRIAPAVPCSELLPAIEEPATIVRTEATKTEDDKLIIDKPKHKGFFGWLKSLFMAN